MIKISEDGFIFCYFQDNSTESVGVILKWGFVALEWNFRIYLGV